MGAAMNVVITGGSGALGQALVKRWLPDPDMRRIVILSRDEAKHARLKARFQDPNDKLRFFLGDVRDLWRLNQAFWDADAIVHAAALKRVDDVAYNPEEAIKTNVLGSLNVINAAVECGVPKVLMISTDKAVEPRNFYGATKQMMEMAAVASNAWTYPRGTAVACTRWGNVWGSTGSVVHVFQQAVRENRPLPITDPGCTRYWLTLDQAAAWVERALWEMTGGEIFVPHNLPVARLAEVAEAVAPKWPQTLVGLRPGGEKLHETLVTADEARGAVRVGPFSVILPEVHPWSGTWPKPCGEVQEMCSRDGEFMTVEKLRRAVE